MQRYSVWPGLRCSKSEVKPHLVSSFTEVAEIPVWWDKWGEREIRVHDEADIKLKSEPQHYLWASSSSLTALSTAFKLLFSSFSTRVASLWRTRATLNISTVSLGATWRALRNTNHKDNIIFVSYFRAKQKPSSLHFTFSNICLHSWSFPHLKRALARYNSTSVFWYL